MLGEGECDCDGIEQGEEEAEKGHERDMEAGAGEKSLGSVNRGAFDDPVHFLFHTEGGKDEPENEHIDEVDGSGYLKGDDDIGNHSRPFGELMIQDEKRAALEQPDEAEESEPAHVSRIAEKGEDFLPKERVEWTSGVRKSADRGMDACYVRGIGFLEMLPEQEMIFP